MTNSTRNDHDDIIARALATQGGHLALGRGGFCLHFAWGSTLSGYGCEPIKAAAVAAGLPVIDSRRIDFEAVVKLAVHGPMVAVGRTPDPKPWHALSSVPLEIVAEAYARAGAEVWNVVGIETVRAPMRGRWSREPAAAHRTLHHNARVRGPACSA